MRRTLQTEVDDRLADLLLAGELEAGDEAHVDAVDGVITVGVDRAEDDRAASAPENPAPED
ncbi:hypothetical protein GCM10010259_69830 [Streptomyces daghestanicus]|uniref:Uncharacterized protein n=1 Tax=Streptomyces daghestanicus TaxID=66885 RepID=A0ABQ3Q432_9ACTN|nr:hypothetical protein GCM10010240_68580 [Streptomyces griseoviridis]GGU70189.1 hypothetical protein GCM10010259_69830 [Streptomyces daghestanicus]GHI32012.1 hypothetical protein Sdagh_37420 [Streptomyces daghestanicus]